MPGGPNPTLPEPVRGVAPHTSARRARPGRRPDPKPVTWRLATVMLLVWKTFVAGRFRLILAGGTMTTPALVLAVGLFFGIMWFIGSVDGLPHDRRQGMRARDAIVGVIVSGCTQFTLRKNRLAWRGDLEGAAAPPDQAVSHRSSKENRTWRMLSRLSRTRSAR